MYDVLNDLGRNIQQFLEAVLPSCDRQWWDNSVLAHLTFQQRRVVEGKRITSLMELDLACLLRVLDQNWHDINASRRLPFEARNWLKEAQSIRNRWAHLPPGGLKPGCAGAKISGSAEVRLPIWLVTKGLPSCL